MSEVHSSTAAGSTTPSASMAPPSSTGNGDGTPGAATFTASSDVASGAEARTYAVQTTFPDPAASTERQPSALFRGGPLLPFRNHENDFLAASTALPQSEPGVAGAVLDVESDAVAEFDRLMGDEPGPDSVQQFFAELSPADRERLASGRAEAVGNLDGVPAALRDQANRRLMGLDLERLEAGETAGAFTPSERRALENIRAVQISLQSVEQQTDWRTGEPLVAELYVYEPVAFGGDGRAAVAAGQLDRADHVSVIVPGLGTTTASMADTGDRAVHLYEQSRHASGDSVAVLEWAGYDAPSGSLISGDVLGVVTQRMARAGAHQLAQDVAGLQAMRGDTSMHLTVIGHSYGAITAAIAADELGLQVDDLILVGSPGAGRAGDANELTTGRDHTWVGSASRDFVTSLAVTGWMDPTQVIAGTHGIPPELLGNDPAEDDFHAQRFQAEHVGRGDSWNLNDHIDRYFEERTESLHNMAAIVTGNYEHVQRAEPRRDPWYAALQDPERHRAPREISH